VKVPTHPGGRPIARWSVVALAVLGLIMSVGVGTALAHGGEDEADPVDLVEQALAIVVNTPDAAAEALERVEAALAAEAANPSGALDIAALEEAATALSNGDLHDAEDALIRALGQDPHAEQPQTPEVEEPRDQPEPQTGPTPAPVPATDVESEEPVSEVPHEEEEASPEHGLTSRVEGGFSTPGPGELAALGAALVVALGGIALVRGKD